MLLDSPDWHQQYVALSVVNAHLKLEKLDSESSSSSVNKNNDSGTDAGNDEGVDDSLEDNKNKNISGGLGVKRSQFRRRNSDGISINQMIKIQLASVPVGTITTNLRTRKKPLSALSMSKSSKDISGSLSNRTNSRQQVVESRSVCTTVICRTGAIKSILFLMIHGKRGVRLQASQVKIRQ